VAGGAFSVDVSSLFEAVTGGNLWLEVSVKGKSDDGYDTLPRVPVASVPFALHAKTADEVDWQNVKNAPASVVGAPGAMGPVGPRGPIGDKGSDGASVVAMSLDAGDKNCPLGAPSSSRAPSRLTRATAPPVRPVPRNAWRRRAERRHWPLRPLQRSFASANGQFKLQVTDTGITLSGPSGTIVLDTAGVHVASTGTLSMTGTQTSVSASSVLSLSGALTRVGGGSSCSPSAAVNDQVTIPPQGNVGTISGGSPTVLVCH